MNRRGFLKSLAAAFATPIVAKMLPAALVAAEAPATTPVRTYLVGKDAVIGQYADYVHYSDFELKSAISYNVSFAMGPPPSTAERIRRLPETSKKEVKFMYVPLA